MTCRLLVAAQTIIWNNAWMLLIRPVGTYFSEILNEIHTYKKMHLDVSLAEGQNEAGHDTS